MVKKKGKKKSTLDDDVWADVVDPIEEVMKQQTAAGSDDDDYAESAPAIAKKPNNKKKSKKQNITASFAALALDDGNDDMLAVPSDNEPEPEPEPEPELEPQPQPAQAAQATAEDDFDDFGPVAGKASKKNKKNKKKGGAGAMNLSEEAPPKANVPDEEPQVVIKSAKQKERERKERQKAQRKAQQPTQQSEQQQLKPGEVKKDEASTPTDTSSKAADAKKAKKKAGINISALQKRLEAQRKEEEERQRREEEEKRRLEEEMRRIEEEERAAEEAKQLKKEKEKARKEELRKQGKLLTKAQREEKRKQEQRLQALLQSGVQVAGLTENAEKKKPVYSSRPKKPSKKEEEERRQKQEENKEEESKEAEVESQEQIDEDEEDDWEALLESSDEEGGKEGATTSAQDIGEEGREDSDDEEDEEGEDIKTASTQQMVGDEADDNMRSPICCVLGHVDTGKCFGRGTPIVMYDGTVRPVETIRDGEYVMGDDGTRRLVTGTTSGMGPMYRITPLVDSSQPFICNDAHILVLTMDRHPSEIVHEPGVVALNYFELRRHAELAELDMVFVGQKWFHYPTAEYPDAKAARTAAAAEGVSRRTEPIIWQPSVETFLKAAPVVQRCARMRAPRQIDCESWSRRRLASILEQAVTSSGSSTDVQVASAAWLLGYWLMAGCSTEFTLSSSKSGYNVARIEKYAQNVDPAATVHVDDAIHILDAAGKSLLAPLIRAAGFLDHSSKRKTMPEWFVREDLDLIRRVFLGGCSAASSSGSSPYASEFGNAARVIHIADAELALKLQYLARCSGFRVACTNSGCGFEIDLSRAEATSADGRHYTWDFRVEALGADRYYGFCVDGNHRFLLGDLTETHNTKLLDKIRQTNVQDQEAGGITQQIGATFFPRDTLDKKIAPVNTTGKVKIRIPGLLTLDTPGHSHFGAIRARGSKLCNIAVLVVDIMHGLEPQTIESIRLLRDRKTPFVVALNKIDRIFGWKSIPDGAFRQSLKMQKKGTISEFEMRVQNTITEFAEQGLNARLYYENKNFAKYVSLVPTSAITGEGIPDLLALLITLTQTRMSSELLFLSKLECAVLEVKVIEGLGTTIDVVLSNGILKEGDRIVVCGLDGPIVTNVRALLTPQPMREMRVKSAYVHHKKIKASMGVKIVAPGLEKAIAGSRMLVVGSDDDEEELIEDVMSDLTSLQNVAKKTDRGVWVQASTLGSLEALLGFLEDSNIPVAGINIGPVHKKDVTRASTMLEKAKEYAVMLCFDVKVEKEAQELADELGVKVFKADIIYHLFDAFTDYNAKIREQKRKDQAPQAIFPCVLNIIKGAVFNKRDPIIIGCDVMEGQLRVGTPVCVVRQNPETKQNDVISLGRVASLEINRKPVDIVRKGEAGGGVAVRIDCPLGETPKMYDRHFTDADPIYSQITRTSIDVLKESFRNDVSRDEWQLIIKLKKMLDIK